MKRIVGILIVVVIIGTFSLAITYAEDIKLTRFILESKVLNSDALSKKVVRFHVIANSNKEVDQYVKLQVKDEVLKEMVPKFNISSSKAESISIINENKEIIKKIAEDTLDKYDMDYDINIVLDTTYFPTKYYKEFSLPAGDYLALRVIIGEGNGKNWWCVLFPPLCLIDVKEDKEYVNEQQSNAILEEENTEDYSEGCKEIISIIDEDSEINVEEQKPKIRWKTLELLGF